MTKVLCIGAGPAGLTAAYYLSQHNTKVCVLEADPRYVGGISRTVEWEGFRFDIGGHRFFSKSEEINVLWKEILGSNLLVRARKSRIYYRHKFYPYPFNLRTTLGNLGLWESLRCGFSYLYSRLFPFKPARNFEQWVSNQFGTRLFRTFFKTYTEKVWGISCRDISADWAAQRIHGLSMLTVLTNALKDALGIAKRGNIKTLIEEFYYPRLGPGMMWEAAAKRIGEQGGDIKLGTKVKALRYEAAEKLWHVVCEDDAEYLAEHVISSMPMRQLIAALRNVPPHVQEAATKLRYRDFLMVALVLKDNHRFDDNWLYIHSPEVKVGRIQNFKTWSPEMVADPQLVCYGMEYFCFEGDTFWQSSDETLIALARKELAQIGLANEDEIIKGHVIRQQKAYPIYDKHYSEQVTIIRDWVDASCTNLQMVGRNGMHKYNNQDHSMMTALMAAKNILAGNTQYDVWRINQDAEYHEKGSSGSTGERMAPLTPVLKAHSLRA